MQQVLHDVSFTAGKSDSLCSTIFTVFIRIKCRISQRNPHSMSFKILFKSQIFSHCCLYNRNLIEIAYIPYAVLMGSTSCLTASFDCKNFILKCNNDNVPEIHIYKVLMLEYTWSPYCQNLYDIFKCKIRCIAIWTLIQKNMLTKIS